MTPLISACNFGNLAHAVLLLQAGANIMAVNKVGAGNLNVIKKLHCVQDGENEVCNT